jgi:hypothetical protein
MFLQLIKNTYHSLSCEANHFLAGQEILRMSWNLNTHYPLHGTQSGIRLLSQTNPVHVLESYFFKSTLNLLSHLGFLFGGLFPLGFFNKTLHTFCFSPYVPHVPPISFSLVWSTE